MLLELKSTEGTSSDQNFTVVILGAALGIALFVVVATIILLVTICYRNKVSFSILYINLIVC